MYLTVRESLTSCRTAWGLEEGNTDSSWPRRAPPHQMSPGDSGDDSSVGLKGKSTSCI